MSEEFLEQLICLLADDNEDIVRHALKDIEKQDNQATDSALSDALDYVVEGVLPELVSILMDRAQLEGKATAEATFARIIAHERSAVRHRIILAAGIDYLTDDVKNLLLLLKNENSPDVQASILSLVDKKYFSEDIVSEITRLITHIDSRVRANAVEALDRLSVRPGEEIIEPLLLDSSPRVKANAIKWCWPYEQDRMERIVLGELKSPDVKRQRCALYLLGVLSPFDDVASILLAELSDVNTDSRSLAVKGLSKLDCSLDYEPIIQAYLRETEQSISEELEAILCRVADNGTSADVLDHLFSVISDNDGCFEFRMRAANVLSRIGGVYALPNIRKCLDLGDDNLTVAAISGIWGIKSPDVIKILEELADDSSSIVSAQALLELCFAGKIPSMGKLTKLASSKELAVLRCGTMALGRYGTLETLSTLVEAYRRITAQVIITDDESEIKSELLSAIENIRSREER